MFQHRYTAAVFLTLILSLAAEEMPQDSARINAISLPRAAQAFSVFGNAVAPGFADSVAMFAVFLGMNPQSAQMDWTQPFSALFYESQPDSPALCIIAKRNPAFRELEKTVRIGSLKMNAVQSGAYIIARTPNLTNSAPAPFQPKSEDSAVLEVLTRPQRLRKQLSLATLAPEKERTFPAAADALIDAFETLDLTLRAPSPDRIQADFSGILTEKSGLGKYLEHPAEFRNIPLFEGAQEVFILNVAADRHFRDYLLKLLPRFQPDHPEEETLRLALSRASSGRIAAGVAFEAETGDVLVKTVFELNEKTAQEVRKALDRFAETPFGVRLIAKEKQPEAERALFARMEKTAAVFYYCPLTQTDLQMLLREKTFSLKQSAPFAVYDLKSGKAAALLHCAGRKVSLKIDADAAFFRQFPALIRTPIHLIENGGRKR